MRYIVVLLVALVALIPSAVSADELWVLNEGGVEVTIWSDSNWEDVMVTGEQGLMGVGPSWEPDEGVAQVYAVAAVHSEWLVIHADNITDYRIDVAGGQDYEDVIPEVNLVRDVLPVVAESVPDVKANDDSSSNDGPSIAEMNAEKAIEEYNEWFTTVSWNELD